MKTLHCSQLGGLTGMLLFVSSSYCLAEYPSLESQGKYIEGEVIVKFKKGFDGARSKDTLSLQETFDATPVQMLPSIGAQVWKINGLPSNHELPNPNNYDSPMLYNESPRTEEMIQQLKNHPLVEYVEPNYIVSAMTSPNDTDFSTLWGLHNTGQENGNLDADIDAPEAWDITTGGEVVIAVIDTGVDAQHSDLARNMWKNPNEIPGNGQDDDGNGYIDDVYGYDFANHDAEPLDDHSHGSHCAGIIAGIGNNGIGVTGVNWKAQIMSVKFLNSFGMGTIASAIQALEYAVKMGAKISNNSWGCRNCASQALRDAIQASSAQGHLFVTAAGNFAEDNDTNSFYPANYDLENLITVTATDHNDELSFFSNYGKENVDLAAPGENIYSTLLGEGYGYKSGTSMAVPYVVGVASLLKACQAEWTFKEIKERLLNTVDSFPALQDKLVSHGRLNAFKAVKDVCPTSPPEPVPQQSTLYLLHDQGLNNSQLYYTSLTDISLQPLGPLYQQCDLEALDISPETDELYAAAGDDTPRPSHLYWVNKINGDLIDLGDLGGPDILHEVDALSFRSNGSLWGWAQCEGLFIVPHLPLPPVEMNEQIHPIVGTDLGEQASCLPPTSESPVIPAELVFPRQSEVEDIDWNDLGNVLYAVENQHSQCKEADVHRDLGGRGVKLWAYSTTLGTVQEICSRNVAEELKNIFDTPVEIEGLEVLPKETSLSSQQDLLLLGFHGKNKMLYLVLAPPLSSDSSECQVLWKDEGISTPDDIEGIAYSPYPQTLP